MKFDLEKAQPLGAADGLAIVVRDRRFSREAVARRWWLGGDPIATAWHNTLSVVFPKGEALFIESVKAHREGAPAKLEAEIRAFIRQEVNHTREHVAFNRMAVDGGYDVSRVERRLDERLAVIRQRDPILNLAATMMLEHLTALLARETLTNPAYMGNAAGELGELWRWHAIEEIEHKAVAYDTWLHATRGWSRFKRWRAKTLVGLIASKNFLIGRYNDTLDMLEQDGLTGLKWKWRLIAYLAWRPGVVRRTFGAWLSFFAPGFHPWKDGDTDRALIGLYDSEFPDAVLHADIARTVTGPVAQPLSA
jgi:predicted metal-dependent hydrolase